MASIDCNTYAFEHGYNRIHNLNADFSHHPRHFPPLLAAMQDGVPGVSGPVDVAIGSRYVAGGGVVGWPLKRRLMSKGVNLYARSLLGQKPKDCSGAYRCYRTSLLTRHAVLKPGDLFSVLVAKSAPPIAISLLFPGMNSVYTSGAATGPSVQVLLDGPKLNQADTSWRRVWILFSE